MNSVNRPDAACSRVIQLYTAEFAECHKIRIAGVLPRRMQNLIRIGVADAAQDSRVGQGPLERAVLRRHRGDEGLEVTVEYLDTAGVGGPQALFALNHVQRRAPLGAR